MWEYYATVKRVVDADTMDLEVDLGFGVLKNDRFRLARIDAWEVRGEERPKGLLAKARVEELCPVGSKVLISTNKEKGKYGRYIAEIIIEFDDQLTNLNDLLVEEGHAELYEA